MVGIVSSTNIPQDLEFSAFVQNYPALQGNPGAKDVYDFLTTPEIICAMLLISRNGLPALSAVVEQLEKNFQASTTFPLNDFRNRQSVGKMVKYILEKFGYSPIANGLDKRAQLQGWTNASLFKTAAVYAPSTDAPQYNISVEIK